ncbi:MAG: SprT family zinc-dependent metalloprotease [Pseudomonadota bacterium]
MRDTEMLERLVADLELPVSVLPRYRSNARHLVLRLAPCGDEAKLTVPTGTPARRIRDFLEDRRDWLVDRSAAAPQAVPFEDGAVVPVEGTDRRIVHDGRHVGAASFGPCSITVGGDRRHINRRVRDTLINLGRQRLSAQARLVAERVERPVAAVSVRDTRSRWGSCSPSGRLSFSWRLILAPQDVLTYVVVHEVAHLVHLDHSQRFWSLVDDLMPSYRAPKAWLKANGRALHRYGKQRSGPNLL